MNNPSFYVVWKVGMTPKEKYSTYREAKRAAEAEMARAGGIVHVLACVATGEQKGIIFDELKYSVYY